MANANAPKSRGGWLASPTAIYLILFFVVPLFFMFVMSILTRGQNLDDYVRPFTTANYTALFENPAENGDFRILMRSLRLALLTTFFCFVLGYPLAFWITLRKRKWVQRVALFFVVLPFWTNFLVRTYAWQIILGRRGVLNEFLFWLSDTIGIQLIERPLEILGTQEAVLIGMVYSFLPFMVLPIYASVERFNFRLVEAGHDLGGNDFRIFRRIVFPLTLPGVLAGSILVFIPAIGAFVTPALLGGTDGFMIGNRITRLFKENGGSWVLGSGMSIVIMLIVGVAVFIYLRYANAERIYVDEKPNIIARAWSALWQGIANIFESIIPQQNRKKSAASRSTIRRDLAVRRIGSTLLSFNALFSFFFLWLPIVLLIIFSFNDSRRAGGRWEGFTTRWYEEIFAGVQGSGSQFSTDQLLDSIVTTLQVSIPATIGAVVLGTMVSLAMERGRFRGKRPLEGLLYIPLVIPDITMGVSILVFFKIIFDFIEAATGTRYFMGIGTVILSHIAFNIAFVVVVIRARLTDMNPRFEEAANDLGANPWQTFRRVTYPLLLPAIIAGGLLAFTISLDDFVVTFFVSGGTTSTLTVYVFGLVRRGISPQINAVSTIMIVVSTLLIGISLLLQGRNANRA